MPRESAGLPRMPQFTFPPASAMRAKDHIGRLQSAVALIIPFLRDFRVNEQEIVEAPQYGAVSAIGTSAFLAFADGSPPFMSQLAFPPEGFVGINRHHLRRQSVVPFRYPLGGDFRFDGRQIVEADKDALSRAERTSRSRAAIRGGRPPAMPEAVFPPETLMGESGNIIRRQDAVFLRVPLQTRFREFCKEVVKAGEDFPSGAVRTSLASAATVNASLPAVSQTAFPAYHLCGKRPNLFGRHMTVALKIPIQEQIRAQRPQIVKTG